MSARYFLYLSRNDTAQVSRLSGSEIKDRAKLSEDENLPFEMSWPVIDKKMEEMLGPDWIEGYFIPYLGSLTEAHTDKFVKGPLTFWARIGGGLFPRAEWEIFLYSTPYTVTTPIIKALKPLDHICLCEGSSYLPEDALPCCQIFRGNLLRFYLENKRAKKFYIPAIYWLIDQPVLALKELDLDSIASQNFEINAHLWVRAEITGKSRKTDDLLSLGEGPTGNHYRILQRKLPGYAIQEEI